MKSVQKCPKQSFVLAQEPHNLSFEYEPCKRNTFGWLHIEQVHPLNKELSLNDSTLSLEFHTSASEVSSQASNCLVIGSYKIGTHGLERISLAPASKYSK